jgi:hypothetical protein
MSTFSVAVIRDVDRPEGQARLGQRDVRRAGQVDGRGHHNVGVRRVVAQHVDVGVELAAAQAGAVERHVDVGARAGGQAAAVGLMASHGGRKAKRIARLLCT